MIYLAIICGILVVIIIIILVWLAYSLSAAYQQTVTVEVAFHDTYRHVANFNTERKYRVDRIKVDVTGKLKKDFASADTVSPGAKLRQLLIKEVVDPYRQSLLMHETQTFLVEEDTLKRCPLSVNPTAENLSVMFFNKLSPLMPEIGAQLVSVKIISEDIKVTHSRYKISDYSV